MTDVVRVISTLSKRYPQKGDMDLGNPKDTLIGVLLSARTRDSQVLKIYPAFQKAFPTFASLAASTPRDIEKSISTIGLYRSKARAIHRLSRMIVEEYGGKVPGRMEDLIRLPGVGRKTANCVLSYVFGQDTICVDTHVFRIAHRLGWSKGKNPERVEVDLERLTPVKWRSIINRTFVRFGREICQPRVPKCEICPVREWCEYGKARMADVSKKTKKHP